MSRRNEARPYTFAELYRMDDEDLGHLYRTKNKEVSDHVFSISTVVGLLFAIPFFIVGVTIKNASFGMACLFAALATGSALAGFAIAAKVSSMIYNHRRLSKGYGAFDTLYKEDDVDVFTVDFQPVLEYFSTQLKDVVINHKDDNDYKRIWSFYRKSSYAILSKDFDLYTDAQVGWLLKIIMPVLNFMINSNEPLDKDSFDILDSQYHMESRMNDFIDKVYNNLASAKRDQHRNKVKDFIEKENSQIEAIDENSRTVNGSSDYQRMKDLNAKLNQRQDDLARKVKKMSNTKQAVQNESSD